MKKQANAEIRARAKNARVFWWQVAQELGVAESTVIRWLRTELDADGKQRILDAISRIEKEDI